jgi:hypothetical protein
LPNIPKILEKGTTGIKHDIEKYLRKGDKLSRDQYLTLEAMKKVLDSLELMPTTSSRRLRGR